jgi:predicted transcriptional regulator
MTSSRNFTSAQQYPEGTRSRRQLLKLIGGTALSVLVLGACTDAPSLEPSLGLGPAEVNVPIGSYTTVKIGGPYGLAEDGTIIGTPDELSSFKLAERSGTQILWFGQGFVEYSVPNIVEQNVVLEALELSMELCSETTLHNNVSKLSTSVNASL